MIQIGQPLSSGHIKQNTPHPLGVEWTIYVVHKACHILYPGLAGVFAGTVCLYALFYPSVDGKYILDIGGTVTKFLHCYGGLITVT